MLFLFNTFSVRLSANMKMMMVKLNKVHVLFFVATNIAYLFLIILTLFNIKHNSKKKYKI